MPKLKVSDIVRLDSKFYFRQMPHNLEDIEIITDYIYSGTYHKYEISNNDFWYYENELVFISRGDQQDLLNYRYGIKK